MDDAVNFEVEIRNDGSGKYTGRVKLGELEFAYSLQDDNSQVEFHDRFGPVRIDKVDNDFLSSRIVHAMQQSRSHGVREFAIQMSGLEDYSFTGVAQVSSFTAVYPVAITEEVERLLSRHRVIDVEAIVG